MEQTENTPDEEKEISVIKKKKRKKHPFRKAFFTLLIFAAIVQTVFYFFATPLLRNYIQQKVYTKTKGLYSIYFNKIVLDISTGSFQFENFHLKPDTNRYKVLVAAGYTKKALYDIKFQKIELKYIRFWKILKNSELYFYRLTVKKPEIQLRSLPSTYKRKEKKYDAIHQDLYPAIAKYFNEVNIEHIQIEDGMLDFYIQSKKTKLSYSARISGELTNFHVDSNIYKLRNKFLYSESIRLNICNYSLELNDSIHLLNADSVYINTGENSIRVVNCKLTPSQIDTSQKKLFNKDIYNIHIPHLKISGFNIDSVYFNKKVGLESVVFDSSYIQVVSPPKQINASKKKIGKKFTMEQLVKGHFNSISVDSFVLNNSKLEIKKNYESVKPDYKVENFTVKLLQFLVDSLSAERKDRIYYAQNIFLDLQNFSLKLNDNIHELTANKLYISTENKQILAKDVHIFPLSTGLNISPKSNKSIIKCNIPFLNFIGIDLKTAYNFEELNIQKLLLQQANIEIHRYNSKDTSHTEIKTEKVNKIYSFIKHFLKSVSITNLAVDSGHFYIQNHNDSSKLAYTESDINLNMKHFFINGEIENTNNKAFNAKEMQIDISNYRMKLANNLHTFEIGNLYLSSVDSVMQLKNLKMQADSGKSVLKLLSKNKKNTYFNISIPQVLINKIDFKDLYYNRRLLVSNITMNRPKIDVISMDKKHSIGRKTYLEEISDTIPEYISNFKKLASIFFQTDTFSGIQFYSQRYKVKLITNKPLQISRNGMHYINNSPTIVCKDSMIFEDSTIIKFNVNNVWRVVTSDSLQIQSFKKQWNIRKDSLIMLTCDTGIWIANHRFLSKIPKSKTFIEKPLSPPDFYTILGNFLDSVSIDSVTQRYGKIHYTKLDSTGKKIMSFENVVQLKLFDFQFSSDSNYIRNKSLLSEKIEVTLSNIDLNLPSKVYSMIVDKIVLSTYKNSIILGNLKIYSNSENVRKLGIRNVFYGVFPRIQLSGVDWIKFQEKKHLEARRIDISKPYLELSSRKEIAKTKGFDITSKLFKLTLPRTLKELQADTVDLNNSELVFLNTENPEISQKSKFRLILYNLLLDTTLNYQNTFSNILYSDNFDLYLLNFQRKLPDGIHTLSSDVINLSTVNNSILLKNTRMDYNPTFNNFEYLNSNNGKPLVQLFMPKAEFKGLLFDSLFSDKKLIAHSFYLSKPQIEISTAKDSIRKKVSLQNIDLTKKILPTFNQVFLDRIVIDEAQINQYQFSEKAVKTKVLNRLSAELDNFEIDSSLNNAGKLLNADDVNIKINAINVKFPDSIYVLQTKNIKASLQELKVEVDSLVYGPKFTDDVLFENNYTKPIMRISGDKILAYNMNIFKYLDEKKFIANKLVANDFRIDISQKFIKKDKDSLQKQISFQKFIRAFKTPFQFDTFNIENSVFTYTSISSRSKEKAHLFMDNLEVSLRNFSNDSVYNQDRIFTLNMNSKLMNEGEMNVNMQCGLADKAEKFKLSGNLESMDLSNLNGYLRPGALVNLRGDNELMKFDMKGDSAIIKGTFNWRYRNLHAELMKANSKSEDTSYSKSGFKSFLVNRVIRTKNPKRKGFPEKTGIIYAKYNPYKTFTYYWFSGIISGAKSIMGMNSRQQKEILKSTLKKGKK